MTCCSASTLFIFFLLLFGHLFGIVYLEFSKFLSLGSVKPLVPHDDPVELLPCDEHIVKLLQCLVHLVHYAEHVVTVALYLLDRIAIEGQNLQGRDCLQVFHFVEISDVVSM